MRKQASRLPVMVLGSVVLAAAMGCAACSRGAAGEDVAALAAGPAEMVGRQVCAGCHGREAELWRGSHHDLAMQEATPETLRGRFVDAVGGRPGRVAPAARGTNGRSGSGTSASFARRGSSSFVRATDAAGREQELPVAYTFGVEPLQQLLIPAHGGRLQAFAVAWDGRAKREGGGRWFALDAEAPQPAGSAAHWSGRDANWNSMCAECHSTGLRKGYQPDEDRFATRWSEIDVACEACHGPGSRHVTWARGGSHQPAPANHGFAVGLRDPNRGAWAIDSGTGSARRTAPLPPRSEVDTCARCHARRTALVETDEPSGSLLDTYRPALLEAGLYHADGQIDGEVFEYGSFLQSRMHAKGVGCSDCHEPHSLKLRFPGGSGNAMCGTCHAPARFERPEHHHHAAAAVHCVDCHMPSRRYMGVDDRRDHSLRVPRPDLTLKIGAPNACNRCHRDRSPAWAQRAVVRWYGDVRSRRPHYG